MKKTFQYIGLIIIITGLVCYSVQAQENKKDSVLSNLSRERNIGYGTQQEWMRSSAISSVTGEKLEQSFTGNLGLTLFGRIGGLTVMQQGNEPGLDSPVMYGRGIGTFNDGREMLILVDGFESSFEHLTSHEIESITLLKDASATAIYGNKGANGVLLVTTKRGSEGALEINLNAQTGFHTAFRLPEFLDSYDYARFYNEALINDGGQPMYSEENLNKYRSGNSPYSHPDVDWYSEVMRQSSPISNYNLNFRGGDKVVRYFGLLNVLSDNSLLINSGDLSENSRNSKFTRYNFRTNVDADLTKALTVNLTIAGSVEDKTNPVSNTTESLFNSLSTLAPNVFPVYNPNGTYGGTSSYFNPVGDVMETGHYTSNGRMLQTSLQLTQKLDVILEGLSLMGGISFNNYFKNYSNKIRTYERYSISESGNEFIYSKYGQKTSLVGDESQSDQWRKLTINGMVTYQKVFGVNTFDALFLYSNDSYSLSGVEHPYRHNSIGGRFTFTNNQKYIGEVSYSYMGSENFHKDNRFGLFPALSLGWIASSEDFFKNDGIVNYLKIRGSLGLVGNDRIGGDRFMFDQIYRYTSSYYFGSGNNSSSSIEEGRLANPLISWEKDLKMNFGFDATILKRVDVAFDIFRNDRYDILVVPNRQIPGFFGLELPLLNEGKVRNQGFEIELYYDGRATNDFNFFVGTNISYAKNKIMEMSEELRQYDYQYRTGMPVDQPFGLEATGFFQNQDDIQNSPYQVFSSNVPGDIKYKDQNNDNIIDVTDITSIGRTNVPVLTVGLTPGMKFKSMDFEMHIQGVSGRSVYLSGPLFHAFQNNSKISSFAVNHWTSENSENATYPRLSANDNLNNYRYSSFWQHNGDFIKIRSIELGYTLNNQLINRFGIASTRIFLNGTNLFSFDYLGHSDPEIMPGSTSYPAMRTLSMGIKVNL